MRFTFACRPKARQAKVNANSSTNSLKIVSLVPYVSLVPPKLPKRNLINKFP
ncbi:MAG: hypothetical protein LBP59_01780 [Planctomycetaceae bacterium]|nr:hypothetical protein [Planctomycetaceae bacterium]